jgi:hypothetical protein
LRARRRGGGWSGAGLRSGRRRREQRKLGEREHLAGAVRLDLRAERDAAGRRGFDDVDAGIDRHGHAPQPVGHLLAIAHDDEPGHPDRVGDDDGEPVQLLLELFRAPVGGPSAVALTRALSGALGVTEGDPGARRSPRLLVALREVEQRADAGVELLALLELRARRGVLSLAHELPGFDEESLGRDGGVVGPAGQARKHHRETDSERASTCHWSEPTQAVCRSTSPVLRRVLCAGRCP